MKCALWNSFSVDLHISCNLIAPEQRHRQVFAFILATIFLYGLSSSLRISREMIQSRKCPDDFQVIENDTAFVYSAYIDDRPTRDAHPFIKYHRPVLKLLVYFLKTIDVKHNWKCMFWFNDQETPVVTSIRGITELNYFSSLRMMVALIICDVPKTPQDCLLRGVSIGKVSSSGQYVNNFVCVRDLRQMSSSASIQATVNNEGSVSNCSNKTVTFTVCTAPIHASYYEFNDIVNFIEVSRIFGAEKFIFYVGADLDPSLRHCLESYSQRGIVEMYSFTPPLLHDSHYFGYVISICDCLYRAMYRTTYLINQDIDEVIVPLQTDGWQAMIDSINSRQSNSNLIASYNFRKQFFPMEDTDDHQFSQMFLVKRYNIKALLKTGKENSIFPHYERSKAMVRPERIHIWQMHFIQKKHLVRKEDDNYLASENDGLVYQYRNAGAYKNNSIRETRMHRWADIMIERIHTGIGICRPID